MPRLMYVIARPVSAQQFLEGQAAWMKSAGFDVAVAVSPGAELTGGSWDGVHCFYIDIPREISPWADIRALISLYRIMRKWRPDIVNASTPKAGLLGMVAAACARVPVRVYVLRGLRLETVSGIKRLVLWWSERVAAGCAHRVLAVSGSLSEVYRRNRLAPASKLKVVGAGSSKGVDIGRFASRPRQETDALRRSLGILSGVPVIGYVGRLTRDKGVADLVDAFDRVREVRPDSRLLLLGQFEEGDPLPADTVRRIMNDEDIIWNGRVSDVAPYYPLMSVLAFPSYREGFPNVPLEAAAAGLAVVGYRATGTVDAVLDGVTGALVDTGDVDALARQLLRYITSTAMRRQQGQAGQQRALREFRPEVINRGLEEEYIELLNNASGSATRAPIRERP